MLSKNPIHNVINWTDETINNIFATFVDRFNDADRLYLEHKNNTIELKRVFLNNKIKSNEICFK